MIIGGHHLLQVLVDRMLERKRYLVRSTEDIPGVRYRDRKLIDKPLRGVKKQVIERRKVEYLA